MSEKSEEIKALAQQCVKKESLLKEVADKLNSSSRRDRQKAASVFDEVSKIDAEALTPYIGDMVDALDQSEVQTRWECLEALSRMVAIDSRACDRGIKGAETALFDEGNDLLHLSAMRFLCALGATTEKRSEKAWPLIDEGMQCCHGDISYQDMLVAIIAFSKGKLSPQVKAELAERVSFDAKNGRGALGIRSRQILENVS